MTVQSTLIGIDSKAASPALSLSPDLHEIVALRRDRWLDGAEGMAANAAAHESSTETAWPEQGVDLAWERLARQRLGLGTALVDVASGVAFAVDIDHAVLLYRVVTNRAAERHLSLSQLIESGEVAAARFVANGILEWLPLPTARNLAEARGDALRLGATPLRQIFALSPLKAAAGVRLTATGGAETLTLDLVPPHVGTKRYPQARRFAWSEVDQPMSYGFGTPAAEQMPAGLAALFSQPWQ